GTDRYPLTRSRPRGPCRVRGQLSAVNQPIIDTSKDRPPRRWGLARGEGIVASIGIVVGVVIVGVLAASSWWTLHTYRLSLERGRQQQVQTVAEYVAEQAAELLSHGEAG